MVHPGKSEPIKAYLYGDEGNIDILMKTYFQFRFNEPILRKLVYEAFVTSIKVYIRTRATKEL